MKSFVSNFDISFVLDKKNIIIHEDIADYKEKPEIVRTNLLARLFYGKVDPKDFMILASIAFSFYFANKGGDNSQSFAAK